jgi:hypothetical protein
MEPAHPQDARIRKTKGNPKGNACSNYIKKTIIHRSKTIFTHCYCEAHYISLSYRQIELANLLCAAELCVFITWACRKITPMHHSSIQQNFTLNFLMNNSFCAFSFEVLAQQHLPGSLSLSLSLSHTNQTPTLLAIMNMNRLSLENFGTSKLKIAAK